MKLIEFVLPYPPSVNTYWRAIVIKGHSRVILSAEGRKFKDSVKKIVAERLEKLGRDKAAGPLYSEKEKLGVFLTLFPPSRRICDVDNYCKASLDALTAAGVWADDSQVDFLQIKRREPVKGGQLHVRIMPAENLSREGLTLDDCPF